MAYIYGTTNWCQNADGSSTKVYQVRLGYELQSQDLINNTSVIKLQLQARSTSSSYKPYGYSQTSHIDGIDFSSKTYDFRSTNTWQTFATTNNITVYHNADGTYNVEKSGYFTSSVSGTRPKRGDATVQVSLPTIPRASQITVNDANIGSATNIVINKASDIFTTTLWYKTIGDNDWIQIVNKTGNQVYGWTVPTSFYQKIPSSKTLYCEFKADTYNGDTYVGTSNVVGATFTATGSPIINSVSGEDINSTSISLTGDSSKMIKYGSIVKVTVSATAQNSSSISSITINGITANNNGEVEFRWTDTNVFNVVVTDSRGNNNTDSITMTMVDYSLLSLSGTATRNTPIDGNVNFNFSGNYWTGNFGVQSNELYVQYRVKESGGSWTNWRTLTPTISGTTYTVSYQESGYDYRHQYEIEIYVFDKIAERTITGIVIPKGEPVYWWNEDTFYVNGYIDSEQTNNYYGIAYSDIDANDLTNNGVYYLVTGCSNIPVSAYFYLVVLRAGYTNYSDMVQFGFDYNCNLYIRFRNGTTWGNWVQK